MPVNESSIVETTLGAMPLHDVAPGVPLVDYTGAHAVPSSLGTRDSKTVVVTTDTGHTLNCLPHLRLRGPRGWVRADATGSDVYLVSSGAGRATSAHVGHVPRGPAVTVLSQDQLCEAIRALRVSEDSSGLMLVVRSGDIDTLRWALLALGIRSTSVAGTVGRRRARRLAEGLLIDQPYAWRYHALVGCMRQDLGHHVTQGARLVGRRVPAVTQAEVLDLLNAQGFSGMTRMPGELRRLQELASLAIGGELLCDEIPEMIDLLERLPVPDVILRNRLLTVLRDARDTSHIVARIANVSVAPRARTLSPHGVGFVANGFACRASPE